MVAIAFQKSCFDEERLGGDTGHGRMFQVEFDVTEQQL